MKSIFLPIATFICIVTTVLSIHSCEPSGKQTDSDAGKILAGNHTLSELRTVKADSTLSGKHLFSIKNDEMTFCWTLQDNSTIVSVLPMSKVRIVTSADTEVPSIKFRWRPYSTSDFDRIFSKEADVIEYAIITCNENDFPNKNKN